MHEKFEALVLIKKRVTLSIKREVQKLIFSCLVYRKFDLDHKLSLQILQYCDASTLFDSCEMNSLCNSILTKLCGKQISPLSDQQVICMVLVLCKCCGQQWARHPESAALSAVIFSDAIYHLLQQADLGVMLISDVLVTFLGLPAPPVIPHACTTNMSLSRPLWLLIAPRVTQTVAACTARLVRAPHAGEGRSLFLSTLEDARRHHVPHVQQLMQCRVCLCVSAVEREEVETLVGDMVEAVVQMAAACLSSCLSLVVGRNRDTHTLPRDASTTTFSTSDSTTGRTSGGGRGRQTTDDLCGWIGSIAAIEVLHAIVFDVFLCSVSAPPDIRSSPESTCQDHHADNCKDPLSPSSASAGGKEGKCSCRCESMHVSMQAKIDTCGTLWSDLVTPLMRALPTLLPSIPPPPSSTAAHKNEGGAYPSRLVQAQQHSTVFVRRQLLDTSLSLFGLLARSHPLHFFHQARCTLPFLRAIMDGCRYNSYAYCCDYDYAGVAISIDPPHPTLKPSSPPDSLHREIEAQTHFDRGALDNMTCCQHILQRLLAFHSKFDAEVLGGVCAGIAHLRYLYQHCHHHFQFQYHCHQLLLQLDTDLCEEPLGAKGSVKSSTFQCDYPLISSPSPLFPMVASMNTHVTLLTALLAKLTTLRNVTGAAIAHTRSCAGMGPEHRCKRQKGTGPGDPPRTPGSTSIHKPGAKYFGIEAGVGILSPQDWLWIRKIWGCTRGVLEWVQSVWTARSGGSLGQGGEGEEGSDGVVSCVGNVLRLLLLLLEVGGGGSGFVGMISSRDSMSVSGTPGTASSVTTPAAGRTHTQSSTITASSSSARAPKDAPDTSWQGLLLDMTSTVAALTLLLLSPALCGPRSQGEHDQDKPTDMSETRKGMACVLSTTSSQICVLGVVLATRCYEIATGSLGMTPAAISGPLIREEGMECGGEGGGALSKIEKEVLLRRTLRQLLDVGGQVGRSIRTALCVLLLQCSTHATPHTSHSSSAAAAADSPSLSLSSSNLWAVLTGLVRALLRTSACREEGHTYSAWAGGPEDPSMHKRHKIEGGAECEGHDRVGQWVRELCAFVGSVLAGVRPAVHGIAGATARQLSELCMEWLLSPHGTFAVATAATSTSGANKRKHNPAHTALCDMPRERLEVGAVLISCLHWPTLWFCGSTPCPSHDKPKPTAFHTTPGSSSLPDDCAFLLAESLVDCAGCNHRNTDPNDCSCACVPWAALRDREASVEGVVQRKGKADHTSASISLLFDQGGECWVCWRQALLRHLSPSCQELVCGCISHPLMLLGAPPVVAMEEGEDAGEEDKLRRHGSSVCHGVCRGGPKEDDNHERCAAARLVVSLLLQGHAPSAACQGNGREERRKEWMQCWSSGGGASDCGENTLRMYLSSVCECEGVMGAQGRIEVYVGLLTECDALLRRNALWEEPPSSNASTTSSISNSSGNAARGSPIHGRGRDPVPNDPTCRPLPAAVSLLRLTQSILITLLDPPSTYSLSSLLPLLQSLSHTLHTRSAALPLSLPSLSAIQALTRNVAGVAQTNLAILSPPLPACHMSKGETGIEGAEETGRVYHGVLRCMEHVSGCLLAIVTRMLGCERACDRQTPKADRAEKLTLACDKFCENSCENGHGGARGGLRESLVEAAMGVGEVYATLFMSPLARVLMSESACSVHPAHVFCECLCLIAESECVPACTPPAVETLVSLLTSPTGGGMERGGGACMLLHAYLCSMWAGGEGFIHSHSTNTTHEDLLQTPIDIYKDMDKHQESDMHQDIYMTIRGRDRRVNTRCRGKGKGMNLMNSPLQNSSSLKRRNAAALSLWMQIPLRPSLSPRTAPPPLRVHSLSACTVSISRLAALLTTLPASIHTQEWALSHLRVPLSPTEHTDTHNTSPSPQQLPLPLPVCLLAPPGPTGERGPTLPYLVLRSLIQVVAEVTTDSDGTLRSAQHRLYRSLLQQDNQSKSPSPVSFSTSSCEQWVAAELVESSSLMTGRCLCLRLVVVCLAVAIQSQLPSREADVAGTSWDTPRNPDPAGSGNGTERQQPPSAKWEAPARALAPPSCWKDLLTLLASNLSTYLQTMTMSCHRRSLGRALEGKWEADVACALQEHMGAAECRMLIGIITEYVDRM